MPPKSIWLTVPTLERLNRGWGTAARRSAASIAAGMQAADIQSSESLSCSVECWRDASRCKDVDMALLRTVLMSESTLSDRNPARIAPDCFCLPANFQIRRSVLYRSNALRCSAALKLADSGEALQTLSSERQS